MPFVSRDENKQIFAVFREQHVDATEELTATSPEVINFLFGDSVQNFSEEHSLLMDMQSLRLSDLGLIRVVEDLICVLMDKNVIDITDLPEPAMERLMTRQTMRNRLEMISRVLREDLDKP